MPPAGGDHRIAAEREAGGADPLRIDPRHKGRVGEHAVDHRAQIARPLPPQCEALDRIAVDRVVAGVVDRGRYIACPGQRGSEPGKTPAGSAGAVRQHDQREFGRGRRKRRICSGLPAIEKRVSWRPEQPRLLLGTQIGRIPDHCGQRVLSIAAPLVRLRRHELACRHADLEKGLRSGRCHAEADYRRKKARQQRRFDHRLRQRHHDRIRLIKPCDGIGASNSCLDLPGMGHSSTAARALLSR